MRTHTKTSSSPAPTTTRARRAATQELYVERVNRAIDFLVRHMGEPLRLEQVARAAELSPFHFHRVFQVLMGETLADFVKRLRLERALFMMAHARGRSLTTIALSCGFSSSSDFSRCFRQQFGVAPSRFDLRTWQREHLAQLDAASAGPTAPLHLQQLPRGAKGEGFSVKIRDVPARSVAYIRVKDPYRPGAVTGAAERLMAWARRHGVAERQWLGYQWESPEITALPACHYHVAVEAEHVTARGEVGRFSFPRMVVAEVEVRGGIDLEIRALQWLYGSWLPASVYVPDDHPCFESWIGPPFADGVDHFELRLQLPVRRG